MKAVIYARVSSTDETQSYDRQISDLRKWANYKDLEIDKIFAEKISGFRKDLDERVAFNEMIDYIEKENIKHIFVSELSRLSRRNIDVVNFIHDCTTKGINIHIHKESLSTLEENGEENSIVKMFTGMLSNMAEQESKTLSYRIKSGKQFSASQGGGFNQKIYGYNKGEDGKPVIDEEKAVLVRKMFEMLLQGIGTRTIANYLNENYDTKDWKAASVHSIVRNSFYCGKRKYNDLIIEVPAIVDEDTFNKAQDFINKRKRFASSNNTNVNPFASFIKCECGATMNQIIIKSARSNVYRCSAKCGVKSVNRDYLIREVKLAAERNAKLTEDDKVRDKFKQNINTEQSNITTHEKRIRYLKMLSDKNYERLLEDKIDEAKYNRYEKKFQTEIDKLNEDIENSKKSIEAFKNQLKNEITHYSDDLSVFKSQLLDVLEWIEIKKELAVVKFKGWAKYTFVIKRGSELQLYNNHLKKMKQGKV